MKAKRVVSVLVAALLAIAVAAPVLAQNNVVPAASADGGSAPGAAITDNQTGTTAAPTRPTGKPAAKIKPKKKKRSFAKRMRDKTEKLLSAIKQ